MKHLLILFTTTFFIAISAQAMDFEEAKRRAWFLTDKMAYELNLTPEQCDKAYQINLDYLMSIRTAYDCYGHYWTYRNMDLRCILFDWQYSLYTTIDYFFRPILWVQSSWYFPIYNHYRRGYYYFNTPIVYNSYRSLGWHRRGHNDISPFHGMKFKPGRGMRDSYHGHKDKRPIGNHNYGRPNNRPQPHVNSDRNPGNQGKPHNYKDRPTQRDYQNHKNIGSNRNPQRGNNINHQERPSTTYRPTKSQRQNSSQSTNNNSNRPNRTFGR